MKRFQFIYWKLPVILWACLVLVLTSLPKLTPPPLGFHAQDKLYHLLFYAVLGWLWARALVKEDSEQWLIKLLRAVLYGSLFGVLDELHQLYIPGRKADVGDALADILGVVIGIIVYKFIKEKYLQNKGIVDNLAQDRDTAIK